MNFSDGFNLILITSRCAGHLLDRLEAEIEIYSRYRQ
jgi:hypothetical protein